MHEIHQYDIQKNGELIDTLECYLNHKQSIRKTSELMGVHAPDSFVSFAKNSKTNEDRL